MYTLVFKSCSSSLLGFFSLILKIKSSFIPSSVIGSLFSGMSVWSKVFYWTVGCFLSTAHLHWWKPVFQQHPGLSECPFQRKWWASHWSIPEWPGQEAMEEHCSTMDDVSEPARNRILFVRRTSDDTWKLANIQQCSKPGHEGLGLGLRREII